MKLKIKAPKIKLPKKIKKPKVTVGKGSVKSLGKIAKSGLNIGKASLESTGKLATGDFKGAGKSAMQGFTSAGDIAGEVGGQAGSVFKGGRQRGDIAGRIAAEIAANAASGGGYGLAKTAAQSLSSDGLEGLLSGKGLQEAALQAGASYAGIDPTMLKAAQMGLKASQGDLEGAAMETLADQFGVDPEQLQMAKSALSGDLQQSVLGLAGKKLGIGDQGMGIARGLASGLSPEEIAKQQALKTGRAVLSDQAGAYEDVAKQYKIASGDTAAKIAKKMGVSLEELKAANPQIKNINKIVKGATLNIPVDDEYKKWEQEQTGYIGKEKKAAMQKLLQDRKNLSTDEFAIARAQISQGKIPQKYKVPVQAPTQAGAQEEGGGFFDSVGDFVKQNPNLVSGAANILGGGAGYLLGEQQRKEALKDLERAMSGYEEIKKTDLASAAEQVQRSPEILAMRKAGLEGIKQRAEMGLTPEDEAMLRQLQKRSLQQGAAQRQALTERAIQQGAQGGQQFMAALQAAGATQQELGEAQDRIGAESFRAKQQALKDLTGASQEALSEDFARDLARAEQMDVIKRFNEQQKLQGVAGLSDLRQKRGEMLLDKGEQQARLAASVGQAISSPIQAQQQAQRNLELAKTMQQPQQAQQQPQQAQQQPQQARQTPVSTAVNVAKQTGIKPLQQAAEAVEQFQGIPFQMPKSKQEAIKTGKDIFDLFKGKK